MPTRIGRSLREYGARAGEVSSQGTRSLANLELGKAQVRGQGIRERGAAFASIPQAVAGAAGQYLQERREAPLRALQTQKITQDVALGEMELVEKFKRLQEENAVDKIMAATSDPKDLPAALRKAGFFKRANDLETAHLTLAKSALDLDESERKKEAAVQNQLAELADFGKLPEAGGLSPELLEQYNTKRQLALSYIANPDIPEDLRRVHGQLWEAETPTVGDIRALNRTAYFSRDAATRLTMAEKEVNIAETKAVREEKNQANFWKDVAKTKPERIPKLLEFHTPKLSPGFMATVPTDPGELIAQAKAMTEEKAATAGTGRTITTRGRIMQFNPESGKYDIDAGPAPAKEPATPGTAEERYLSRSAQRLGKSVDQLTQEEENALLGEYAAAKKNGNEPDLPDSLLDIPKEDTLWNSLGWWTTGPLSAIPRSLGTLTGTMQEPIANRQKFDSAKNTMLRALAENPRFPVAEAERIAKEIQITPNLWDSKTTIRTRMREVDRYLTGIEQRRRAAKDDNSAMAIQQFRSWMGVPGSKAKSEVIEVEMPDGSIKKFDQSGSPVK